MNISIKNIKKNIMHVLSGTILTEDFFLKNTRFMLVVFIIMVFYISNRYSCISKLAEIESLKRELKDAKFESLSISSELTGLSRQAQVRSLVERNGLDLDFPSDPSYKVEQ
ncbi:MAG: FtsL-like putative cell division protein [Dysgonomonas sp.]|nr:FtsL-like putative cell division protein [Dysgonomonas sp.]